MDFNATIDLIIKDLDDARIIIDDLKKYQGVPLLQVELAKAKCKSAAEVISLLKEKAGHFTGATEIPGEPEGPENVSQEPEDGKTPKKTSAKIPESPRIGDKFSHLSNRFNEQMGSRKGEDDLDETVNTKPLRSLTEAIGINDRFFYIREIFNGNKEEYNQAILRLENAGNIKDARDIIMSYTGDSEENKAIKQLLGLVKRKLSPHE